MRVLRAGARAENAESAARAALAARAKVLSVLHVRACWAAKVTGRCRHRGDTCACNQGGVRGPGGTAAQVWGSHPAPEANGPPGALRPQVRPATPAA